MSKFLEKYKLAKMTEDERENLNSLISTKEIKFTTKNFLAK